MAMGNAKAIKIGICGLGVVGQGVWKHLRRNGKLLEARLGVRLEPVRAAVRDLEKSRPVRIPRDRLTDDVMSLARDPELDIVCELMGGSDLAREFTLAALENGKVVVSANKALVCDHGREVFETARLGGGHYFFEASVGGGIPIIKALREGLVANRFDLIYGVLNGTCNYILTRMEAENLSFEDLVKRARKLGYVEADESLDLDGIDTAHKAVILGFLAHGRWMRLDEMLVEGIRRVTLEDIRQAAGLGYSIKLLAVITRDFESNRMFIRVHPALVPRGRVLANLDGAYNGICLSGDIVGTTFYIGKGAGQDATASAVISDIADAALVIKGSHKLLLPDEALSIHEERSTPCGILPLEEVVSPYYLRLTVKDEPGVLAQVASAMARHEVSIASVVQRQATGADRASLILTTHDSNEYAIRRAVAELGGLTSCLEEPFLMRIADFDE